MSLIILLISVFIHSFHLSKTEINYDEDTNALQIATKVFIDDLEDELKLYGYSNLKIGDIQEARNVDSLLLVYFKNNIQFDGKSLMDSYEFVGKELSDDLIAIWAYIEVPLTNQYEELEIKNTILTNLYSDQKNMVIVKKNNKMIQHKILNATETSFFIQLND